MNPSRQDIQAVVIDIVSQQGSIDGDLPLTDPLEKHDLDSLDVVEIELVLEDRWDKLYSVTFDWYPETTIGQIIDDVVKVLAP